jgi:hypothetical protein
MRGFEAKGYYFQLVPMGVNNLPIFKENFSPKIRLLH